MPIPGPIILLLVLLGLGACVLLAVRYTIRLRDRVFSPRETVVGDGMRSALLIYQPSRHKGALRVAKVVAERLARGGYTVKINRPSGGLTYDPMNFSYLIFGGMAYMDDLGTPLKDYLSSLSFQGKRVLLYTVGDSDKAPELAGLRLCVPAGNSIRSIKVERADIQKLCDFAAAES